MSENSFHDGLFKTRVVEQPHEGLTYVERTQLNEKQILAENAELRKHEQKKMDWGRMVMQIPQIAMPQLYRDYPELKGDRHQRNRALQKIKHDHPEWLVVPKIKV